MSSHCGAVAGSYKEAIMCFFLLLRPNSGPNCRFITHDHGTRLMGDKNPILACSGIVLGLFEDENDI